MSEALLLLAPAKTTNFTHGEPGYPGPTTLHFFVFFSMYHYSLELYKKYLIIGFVNEGSRKVGRGGGFLSLRNLFPILTTGTQSPSSFRGSCPSVAKDKFIQI